MRRALLNCQTVPGKTGPHKGVFFLKALSFLSFWIPACAGMTKRGRGRSCLS